MKILGIDPGLQKTGWGIILSEGHTLKFIASGLIKPDLSMPLGKRLACIHESIASLVSAHNPDTAAIEETFVNMNPASTLKLGQARGTALAALSLGGLDVGEYSANKVKKSVVGTGHAGKDQIGMMVKTLLPASGVVSVDEADALAVAICHAHYWKSNNINLSTDKAV